MLFWSVGDYKIWQESMVKKRKKSSNPYFQSIDDDVFNDRILALQKMEDYAAEQILCRREVMLRYFGQRYKSDKCQSNIDTICDNCLKSFNKIN